jgi:glycosyltransferase involved in cell wall biosynthesis
MNNIPSKKLFISVIVPAYNNGRFIKAALESLLKQTYPRELTEIIVIDDGSTDNTREVLKEYGEKIIYIYQENMGIAGARNRGMSLTKGEIITFLDADDMWREDRIEKVAEAFVNNEDVKLVYHPVRVVDRASSVLFDNFYKVFGYREGLGGWITNDIIAGRVFCGGSSFAFRKEAAESAFPVPEDIRRGIDYYMAVISSVCGRAEYIPDLLGEYRLHDANITMLAGQDNYKDLAAINKDFASTRRKVIDRLMSMNSQRENAADINIIRRIRAKEIIFYNALTGRRIEGIKHIPLLFKGSLSAKDLVRGIATSIMVLFVPAFLYPKLVKLHGLFSRLQL